MKPAFTFFLIFCSVFAYSQSVLPTDEKGKVAFIEVVKTDSLGKELLYENAGKWLQANNFQLQVSAEDSIAGKWVAWQSFPVYARGYISKKIHGKINYTLTVAVKENRYRYEFSNFTFDYYKENRNYEMVPTGKHKALEEPQASGWQSLWEQHKKTTLNTVNTLVGSLKTAIIEIPKPKTETVLSKKATSQDW
jgi:hypothetical protein